MFLVLELFWISSPTNVLHYNSWTIGRIGTQIVVSVNIDKG